MKRPAFLLFLFCTFISLNVFAQIGGNNTYEFLELSPSARSAGMGGSLITVSDGDLSLAYLNPAILSAEMDNKISVNTTFFPAGIKYGYAAYARNFDKIKTIFASGVQFISYGRFNWTNDNRDALGSFEVGEYALNISAEREYTPNYTYGANLKFIYSPLQFHTSMGAAVDLAGTYHNPVKKFTASLVMRNIGYQFKPYTKGDHELLPFDIQFGVSQRLSKAPFLVSLVAHTIEKADIRYNNPADQNEVSILNDTTQSQKDKKYIFDKVMRHFIIGTELYLGKNFTIDLGYNHERRMELAVPTRRGSTGFSVGFNVKIKKFSLSYSHAIYHQGASTNNLSLSFNLKDFTHS